jgi:hypothetical protein
MSEIPVIKIPEYEHSIPANTTKSPIFQATLKTPIFTPARSPFLSPILSPEISPHHSRKPSTTHAQKVKDPHMKDLSKVLNENILRSTGKFIQESRLRSDRIIALLYQLQKSIRPDRFNFAINLLILLLLFAVNITGYYNLNLISMIINYISMTFTVILFIREVYKHFTFSLRYKVGDRQFMIAENDGIYELEIIA